MVREIRSRGEGQSVRIISKMMREMGSSAGEIICQDDKEDG
jgi:hypothetical protein